MSTNISAISEHLENIEFKPQPTFGTAAERARRNLNAKLSNPLAGFNHAELRRQGRKFAITHEIGDEPDIRAFELGAVLAQSPERYANVAGLTGQEMEVLRREFAHRWSTVVDVCGYCSVLVVGCRAGNGYAILDFT